MQVTLKSCYEVDRKEAKGLKSYIYESTVGSYMGKTVMVSSVTMKNGKVYFPRNTKKFLGIYDDVAVNDYRNKVSLPNINAKVADTFKFREYQVRPVNKLISKFKRKQTDILFQCDTGFGKTFLIPYIITQLKQKTLIVTDRVLLNEQMRDSIQSNSDLRVYLLDKKLDIETKDVVITTFQFLNKNLDILEKLQDEFGLLVLDEVHIVGAKTYLNVVNNINSYYRLGLSATPTRSDGLTEIITDTLEHKVVGINPNKLVPEVKMVEYDLTVGGYGNSFKAIVGNFLRDDMVSDLVIKEISKLVKRKRKIFLVIDEQKTQKHYEKLLNGKKIVTKVINSNTKNKTEIFKGVEEDKVDVLIGCKVMEKGIDVPRLDTMIYLYGNSTKEALEQLIGRISRIHKNKQKPLVIDFMFGGIMSKSTDNRFNIYSNLEKAGKVICEYKFKELL